MKKIYIKVLSVLFLIASIFMQTSTVNAETGVTENSATIKITGLVEGSTVKVYKIIDYNFDYTNQQTVAPTYKWNDKVKGWVDANHSSYISDEVGEVDAVTEEYSKKNQESLNEFIDQMAKNIVDNTIDYTSSSFEATTTSTEVIFENKANGAYLVIIENGVDIYNPVVVNVIPTHKGSIYVNADPYIVNLKSSTPSIKSELVESDHAYEVLNYNIGDTIHHSITVDVPKYSANAIHKKIQLADDLSDMVTLDDSTIKVYGKDSSNTETLIDASKYMLESDVSDIVDNSITNDFIIKFEDYSNIESYSKIVVKYDATLNETATVGTKIINNARMNYNNKQFTDANSYKASADEVSVYTYGMEITKVDKEDTSTVLSGAEFELYRGNISTKDANLLIKMIKVNDGEYRLVTEGEVAATSVTVNSAGKLKISGLDAGNYTLFETKAPSGYNLPNAPLNVVIADDPIDGVITGTVNSVDTTVNNGYIQFNITNSKGFKLPETGGIGTYLFTLTGMTLIALGIFFFIILFKRRKDDEEEEGHNLH